MVTKGKHKTVQLIIKTKLTNKEILDIFNNGTTNLKELGIKLLEIRVVGHACSYVKGIDYTNWREIKK